MNEYLESWVILRGIQNAVGMTLPCLTSVFQLFMGGVGYMEVLKKDEAWPAIFRDLLFFSALPPNTRHMTQHS